jgi:MFS family permease
MTVAVFTGGLVSLYAWGRIADGVGPEPVLRWTSIGMGASYLGLLVLDAPDALNLSWAVGFFFVHAVLAAGYGVAETQLLFELTPPEAPAQRLVAADVIVHVISAGGPLLAGLALDALLSRTDTPLAVYHGFFTIAAVLQAASFLPLRGFARPAAR